MKTRFIFRCGNKACGRVWAREYDSRMVPVGYGRSVPRYERETETGRKVEAGYDTRCPSCSGMRAQASRVAGFRTAHACDARCTEAKGFKCECSCGGKNHGRAHLICE
ncbi:hypothetical protein [Acidocella aminolytica]|uniref:Uncharacterized protein n=1 Tax=Acidocella aminolytica 101 = DSM 11237 TaxID=1120923 RepID=A0A0D6PG33_9PROT|nr:hypothetical protein [Acidocella aminolytica]GAN79799.1 hypothetical protein Aam_030_032 [Acidocella aminolytica 101 = DSM 11237]GBQ34294.1 hypothetical protein AA11237_0705 [Acidocella aminolytica 101 = DSM 11237]SHF35400.1 hypothetical protein SAMN02746095_02934 [Acidocella aminolytica 101 = DSM 11237]